MWCAFGDGLPTGLGVDMWTWWQKFDFSACDSPTSRVCGTLRSCCALLWRSTVTVTMSNLGHGSAIWAHRAQAQTMPRSHDAHGSISMDMNSLGMMDLYLSLSPDAFGLLDFDHKKPITRMLPGSTPCELWLMLPDSMLGTDGFHVALIDNLAASPSWRSSHISPADVTALRRRWPKAVFKTLSRRVPDVVRLRRNARNRSDRAFRHNAPGFCAVCDVKVDSALAVHMVTFHLALAQLWRCPVEWCMVWKGSVRACLEHLNEKHGGSTFFVLKNVAKLFPLWTVTRSIWQAALRPDVSGVAVDVLLFHEVGCRLVHPYRVYKDPFPHPADSCPV